MRIKKVGVKLALQIMVIIIVVMALIFITVLKSTSVLVQDALEQQSKMANQFLAQSLDQMQDNALSHAASWAQSASIIAAVQLQDTEYLLRILPESDMDYITITDQKGIVLARNYSDVKGDSILHQSVVSQVLESGTSVSSLEPGAEMGLAVRGGAPIVNGNGTIIGVLTCGYDLSQDKYVEQIKNQSNCEITIFLDDTRISTTLRDIDGNSVVGTTASADIVQQVLQDGKEYAGTMEAWGKHYTVIYTPLKHEGVTVGMLFSGVEIDEVLNAEKSMVRQVAAIIVLSAIMVCIFINVAAHFSITRPLKKIGDAAKRLEAGDLGLGTGKKIEINIHKMDEVGELANTLENTCQALCGYIGEIDTRIQELSSGRLDIHCDYPFQGDFISIKNAINHIIQNFHGLMEQLKSISVQITMGSEELASVAARVSEMSSAQSVSIHQLSSAITDIYVQAETTDQSTVSAFRQIEGVRGEMDSNTLQMELLTKAIEDICLAAQGISSVLKTIESFAFQTNILALNASVEAARAGQHGKGFSVVAEEVRTLARKSSEASKESAVYIQNTLKAVETGRNLSQEMTNSFQSTLERTLEVSQHMGQVQQDVKRQTSSIQEMNNSVETISNVIEENSGTAQVNASASEELAAQAEVLMQIISEFRLKERELPEREIVSSPDSEKIESSGFSLEIGSSKY